LKKIDSGGSSFSIRVTAASSSTSRRRREIGDASHRREQRLVHIGGDDARPFACHRERGGVADACPAAVTKRSCLRVFRHGGCARNGGFYAMRTNRQL